ncbi:hypothetical protein [Embleya sp. MST-111070]|uniref:hypothetical protein n=1 Tax=Embleya sp. MST-111070 TaxID=3398231 RepID=UPI003F732EA3
MAKRYATSTPKSVVLHSQGINSRRADCGRMAEHVVDADAASFGLATQTMRHCKSCVNTRTARRHAELSLASGVMLVETMTPKKRKPAAVVEVELPMRDEPAVETEPTTADEPSDTWTITNRAGEEVARVEGATAEEATRAADALPAVQTTIRREGGFARRRLYTSELLPAVVEAGQPTVVTYYFLRYDGMPSGRQTRQYCDSMVDLAIEFDLVPTEMVEETVTLYPGQDATTTTRVVRSSVPVEPTRDERLDRLAADVAQQHDEADALLADIAQTGSDLALLAVEVADFGAAVDALAEQHAVEGVVVEPAPAEPVPGALVDPWTWLRRSTSNHATRRTASAVVEVPADSATDATLRAARTALARLVAPEREPMTAGCLPCHADRGSVRAAVEVLRAAGHTPALLVGDGSESDATGFVVEPHGAGRVSVAHMVLGSTDRSDGSAWAGYLRAYAHALRISGWTIEPHTVDRAVAIVPELDFEAVVRSALASVDPASNEAHVLRACLTPPID